MANPGGTMGRMTQLAAIVALATAPLLAGFNHGGGGDDIASTLEVPVGSSRVVQVQGLSKIAVGDPQVAGVRAVGGSQVLVIGQSEGRTTLMIWKGNGQRISYTIVVRKIDPNEVVNEIKRLLGDREGITVRVVGDHIYLDGNAYTQEDYDRVQSITEIYPNVRSFVRVSPNAKRLVANNLNAQFQRAGMKNVIARVVGSTIFLEGSVESDQDLKRADLITKALGEKVENLLTVGIKKMIMADVQFVEIRKNTLDNIGVKWPTDLSGPLDITAQIVGALGVPAPPGGTWNLSAGPMESGFQIGLLLTDGYARLLAQPRLVCASGEKAEFLAGGEIPIIFETFSTTEVDYKEYGVILKLQPTADDQGNIQMKLEGEVSEIDWSVAVSQGTNTKIPGFRTRRFRTDVGVKHGEAIVLSGVFNHSEEKDVDKMPPFSYIPILGELFKYHTFTEAKQELLIWVKPYIVTPDSDRVVRMIRDMEQRYKEAHDEVNYSVFD
ncbi:MAG: type II and III secretion system protein family protein [Deltaproteobacteria bacterium]